MGTYRDVGAGHRVQCLPTEQAGVVTLLWEHDTQPGYAVPRHLISSEAGATWSLSESDGRITLSPSLHCAQALGGCGVHGFVRDGSWIDA